MLSIRRGPRCRCPVLAPPRAYLGSPAAPCRCRPAPCNPLNTSAGCVPPSTPQTLHVFSHHLPLLTFPSPTRPARLLTAGQTLGPDTGSHHVDRPCRVLQRSIHTTRVNLLLPPSPPRMPRSSPHSRTRRRTPRRCNPRLPLPPLLQPEAAAAQRGAMRSPQCYRVSYRAASLSTGTSWPRTSCLCVPPRLSASSVRGQCSPRSDASGHRTRAWRARIWGSRAWGSRQTPSRTKVSICPRHHEAHTCNPVHLAYNPMRTTCSPMYPDCNPMYPACIPTDLRC